MASLELQDTRSDLVVDKGDGIEPPPKGLMNWRRPSRSYWIEL